MRNRIYSRIRLNPLEISGSFGDLGSFIPLVVPMIILCDLDAGSVFFWAGFFSITTGFLFGLPVPVQPMKAIAAVAIAERLTAGEIAAAGLVTGLIIFLMAISRLLKNIVPFIPREIIRGIQMGVGASLAIKGLTMLSSHKYAAFWDLPLLVLCIVFIITGLKVKKLPGALLVFTIGLIAVFSGSPAVLENTVFGWQGLSYTFPNGSEWLSGCVKGSLPQIPLTVLNSVIAICALSRGLFPGKGIPDARMAYSVAAMNVGCLFGAMPMCHGSGGLAAQYRFGSRSGGGMVFMGLVKMAVGIFLGSSVIKVLADYPPSVLGLLLIVSGIELSRPGLKNKGLRQHLTGFVTALVIVISNAAVGFLAGIILFIGFKSLPSLITAFKR
ncbi:putative sulfate/molybdate transporter [Fibrobacterota bacterium]